VSQGTEITLRPPHRTRRALLTHRAPTLDGDEEPFLRPRMQDAWEWQVPVGDRLHSGAFLDAPYSLRLVQAFAGMPDRFIQQHIVQLIDQIVASIRAVVP
jgi:hypothetical protein